MNPPRVSDFDYFHFLVAPQKVFAATDAARSQPETRNAPANGAFTRLLRGEPPNTEALWNEAKTLARVTQGNCLEKTW